MSFLYTALYSAILALIFIGLSLYVVKMRWKFQVGLGDGGNKEMMKAVRIHANFSEYIPLALLLMAFLESLIQTSALIHVFGVTLIIGRILHLLGLKKSIGTSQGRFIGMGITFVVIVVLALMLMFKCSYIIYQ